MHLNNYNLPILNKKGTYFRNSSMAGILISIDVTLNSLKCYFELILGYSCNNYMFNI